MKTGRVSGKTALVTGAAQGIGFAIASALKAEGASVILSDVNEPALMASAAELGVEWCVMDVADPESIRRCAQKHTQVNVLVNCAGVVKTGTILDCTESDWEASFLVNTTAMYRTIRAFLPAMLEDGAGSIINIASVVSSMRGVPGRCAYGASKAAVIGMTKSVAIDFIDKGIRCNCICPGTVESPSLHDRLRASGDFKSALDDFRKRQPMGRLGQPGEIAAVALMFASDEVEFMTGSAVTIDGGMSI